MSIDEEIALYKAKGATHFIPMMDGVTPQSWYREGKSGLEFLPFGGSWRPSFLSEVERKRLVKIK